MIHIINEHLEQAQSLVKILFVDLAVPQVPFQLTCWWRIGGSRGKSQVYFVD